MAIRQTATASRRRQILDAALECFTEFGFDRTTMADIVARSSASTGSVYHHFRSKEQLAGTLYIEGIGEALRGAARELARETTAEGGVKALARGYSLWIEAHPKIASFCLLSRGAGFLDAAREGLEEVNLEMQSAVLEWMQPHLESGALPILDPTLYWAVLMGPSDHVARQWALHPEDLDLVAARQVLEDSAWAAVQALGSDG